jgi:hypothetical protein
MPPKERPSLPLSPEPPGPILATELDTVVDQEDPDQSSQPVVPTAARRKPPGAIVDEVVPQPLIFPLAIFIAEVVAHVELFQISVVFMGFENEDVKPPKQRAAEVVPLPAKPYRAT